MFKSSISRIGGQHAAHDMEELNFYESEFDDFKKKSKRRKLWQATDVTADLPFFLLEVFSEIWIAWNLILFAVIAYDQFMIPFSVAFNFELTGKFFAVDILCFFLLAADIFLRAKTAITHPKRFSFDKHEVFDYYINTWFILDLFATIPFCYLIMITGEVGPRIIAMARLPRLLKIFRVVETFQIIENNTDVSI